ncbi:hypothetical protein ACTFAO_21810, partial [Sphingobacterium spiritivorum]
ASSAFAGIPTGNTIQAQATLRLCLRHPNGTAKPGQRLKTAILSVQFCYFLGYSTSMLLVRISTDASTAFAAVPTGNTIQPQASLRSCLRHINNND